MLVTPIDMNEIRGIQGSGIMVHGYCASAGCYAMGNKNIEEIYTLLEVALSHNQPFVRIHIFPFKFTPKRMLKSHINSENFDFWKNLYEGYLYFETFKRPPNVTVKNKKYVFN